MSLTTQPLLRRLWLSSTVLLIAAILFPLSNRFTRLGSLLLLFIVWFGLIWLGWRLRVMRFLLLGCTALMAGFLLLPARRLPPVDMLREDYLVSLRRYEGVPYFWGGEGIKGIDCSGLIRRGLMDALLLRGFRELNPGLVRNALSLWWNDCSAKALGENHRGLTIPLLETRGINQLDHGDIQPGDLAVTSNGVHIMAYLGNRLWIEADPGMGRVITVAVPATDNPWFDMPMEVVRWRVLAR